jgi:hypothetical protein
LFPRPPPEGLPVVLGALLGLAMIITYQLVEVIANAAGCSDLISIADVEIIEDSEKGRKVSRHGKF